jgi:hypothetical protein
MEHAPQMGDTEKNMQLQMTNYLQIKLIEEAKADPALWIDENGASFRKIIEDEGEYLTNLFMTNPKECLKEIEHRLQDEKSSVESN